MLVPCLVETLAACGLLMHRPDLCFKDEWRRRWGTAHRREPSVVGRAPMGPAHLTDSLSQQNSFQTARGVCESAEGLFTRPGEIAHGCSFDGGDIDGGASTGAGHAGEWHRLPAVGVDAVAGLLGSQGGGDDPAVGALLVRYR